MPETLTPPAPVITPPALPNPVIVGGFESAIERDYRRTQEAAVRPNGDGGGIDANALETARAKDRGQQQAPPKLAPASNTPNNRSEQDKANMLRMRPKEVRKAADWEHVNTERDRYRQEAETLRAQIDAAQRNNGEVPQLPVNQNGVPASSNGNQPAQGAVSGDIKAHPDYVKLQTERDTFYEEIKHVRVEADPEFRAKFDTKRDAAIRIAKSVSGQAGDDIERILKINDPDVRQPQLADRIKDFSEGSKQRIIAANSALVTVDVEREMEIQSRKASWDATQSQREQASQQQFSQRMTKLDGEFNNVLTAWSDPEKGMPFMIDDAVKNRVVPEARKIFGGDSNPRQLAEASLKAAMFPELLKMAIHAYGEVERLSGTADRYRNSYPGSESGGFVQTGSQNGTPPPIRLDTLDSRFMGGLEEARARDQGRK